MQPAPYILHAHGLSQRMRMSAVLGPMLAAAALVAGCGGGGSDREAANVRTPATRSSSHSSSASSYAHALVYAKCVRTHGVPLWPAPGSGGQFYKSDLTPQQLGVSSLKVAAVQRACRSLVPTYSADQPSSVVATEALRFSRCMRAHGSTNFPDPKSNGAIVIPHAMENSPVYLSALRVCIRKYGAPPQPAP